VIRAVAGQTTSDGAGVRLRRTIGAGIDHIDPFLLFDEFKSDQAADYIAGFPDHPHRGFETVTYMLAGRMEHRDHAGNRGNLVAGSVQWMTAGRGIIHSEMPKQEDGLMWGFQLWVNLPAAQKMTAPRYQDIAPEDVPEVAIDGGRVRIVAGEVPDGDGAVRGAVSGIVTDPLYLDITVDPGKTVTIPIGESHNGFVYPFEGEGAIGGPDSPTTLTAGTLGVLGRRRSFRGGRVVPHSRRCRPAHRRADRAVRTVRHEHAGGDRTGLRRLSERHLPRWGPVDRLLHPSLLPPSLPPGSPRKQGRTGLPRRRQSPSAAVDPLVKPRTVPPCGGSTRRSPRR
jgi:hypothetical protein